MIVPLHPEAVPGRPDQLRWVVPAGTLTFVGEPAQVPAPLQSLRDDGTVLGLEVEPDAVRVTLEPDRTWRTEGGRVRSALLAALEEPGDWSPSATASHDDVLRMAVEQVIAGDVGDYVRGHGGRVGLLAVHDDTVEVSLGGACAHCPASDATLTERFEQAVRARYPALREVVARADPSSEGLARGRRLLDLFPQRDR